MRKVLRNCFEMLSFAFLKQPERNMPPTLPQKIGAMSVHVFTTSGIIAGFYAIVNIAAGDFKTAFWLLLLCQVIDGIDGTFARIFKVTETLPWMDGKMIDYVVDFCT